VGRCAFSCLVSCPIPSVKTEEECDVSDGVEERVELITDEEIPVLNWIKTGK